MSKKILRLLLTDKCNRDCEGCCNKDWDLKALPVCDDFSKFDEIILTGGELMLLSRDKLESVLEHIKSQTSVKIYFYTAFRFEHSKLLWFLSQTDGITLTLHEQKDVNFHYWFFYEIFMQDLWLHKSLRLNVFKGIEIEGVPLVAWTIKKNIEWIKDCPLPENEVFMRYEFND